MSTHTNQAVWLNAKAQPFTVSEAPITRPVADEILIRTRAVALNPFDGVVQTLGGLATPWLSYPSILGSDVAGEVVELGSSSSKFKVGDRVLGLALGIDKLANRAAEGGFQHYVLLREDATTAIPDSIEFEQAAVLPLAIATAACGLFLNDQLNLQWPAPGGQASTGKTVIIWGGSTSIGSCAIQLAVAAGYKVLTTASPRNFDYVKKLGAEMIYDYNEPAVVSKIVKALKGSEIVGALAITVGSGTPCIDIVSQCQGGRIVCMASSPCRLDDAPLENQLLWRVKRFPRLAAGFLFLAIKARFKSVAIRSIWGTALVKEALGPFIFSDFLGPALASGNFVPAPPPMVVGSSLQDIPNAINILRQGVSAKKVIVSL